MVGTLVRLPAVPLPWAHCSHTFASITKQYNLVLAGKVCLAESIGILLPY